MMKLKLRQRVEEIRKQDQTNALPPDIAELLDGLATLPDEIEINDADIPVKTKKLYFILFFVTLHSISYLKRLNLVKENTPSMFIFIY